MICLLSISMSIMLKSTALLNKNLMEKQENTLIELIDREQDLNPRQIRAKGFIPVTVYGKNIGHQSISAQIETFAFTRLRKNPFFKYLKAKLPGTKKEHLLLLKAIEKNPVTDKIFNIQFHSVENTENISINVPITYTGSSPAVRAGGSLFVNKKSVNLKCQAKDIPDYIEFDLAFFEIGKHFAYYTDLQLPSKTTLNSSAEQIIAKVESKQQATEEDTEAEAAASA